MAIAEDHLWCPSLDTELRPRAEKFIQAFGMYNQALQNGGGDLGKFSPTSKLYILAHGHSQMPLFSTKNGKWTAKELVQMLDADGLPKDQRIVELLVCHAGESVNDKATGAKLLALREQVIKAKAKNKSIDGIAKKYDKVAAKGTKPDFFESDPEKLLLPMAAQLSQALKDCGYTHFSIISYKCPVAQYSPDARVYLDLSSKDGQWGVPAEDHPSYRVIWH